MTPAPATSEECEACRIVNASPEAGIYEERAHGGFSQHHALLAERTRERDEARKERDDESVELNVVLANIHRIRCSGFLTRAQLEAQLRAVYDESQARRALSNGERGR